MDDPRWPGKRPARRHFSAERERRQTTHRPGAAGLLGLLALLLPALTPTLAAPSQLERQRAGYVAAREAIERGSLATWRAMAPALRDYPLYPYLLYAELRALLPRSDPRTLAPRVSDYLARFGALPTASRLRIAWLEHLAAEGDWERFRAFEEPGIEDVEIRCHALTARLATGAGADLDSGNVDLWLHGRSRPGACDPVFDHWTRTGGITPALVLERARLATLAGQPGLARYLARRLDAQQSAVVEEWLAAAAQPERSLARLERWSEAARNPDLVEALLRSLARRDILAAYRVLPEARTVLSPDQSLALERDLAVLRATDYGPDAMERLVDLPAAAVNQRVREWRARVAIAEGDWAALLRAVEDMPGAARSDDRWRYWWSRAAEALGRGDEARGILGELALEANYHGFLAADRIDAAYALCPDTESAPALDLTTAPGIQRALELRAVDQLRDARREWYAATRSMDPERRLAAALLAAERGWHHQAILDLAGLGRLDRYRERFPVVWPEAVATHAERHALPPSLVYAVMRSESALAADARSGAGAYGLMQVLPGTARSVAAAAGLRPPSRSRLLDAETNIALGTAYLRKLVEDHDHPLRVLAAYNAGPRPLERWAASGRLPPEPDRWIETLPYYETREYVPRVLTFQAIYEWQLTGRMTRLARMMRTLDDASAWPRRWGPGEVAPVCPAVRVAALPEP